MLISKDIIQQITDIVGKNHCTTSKEALHCYSYDGTGMTFMPDAVALPDTVDQVSKIMQLACLHKFPVVPRGAGSGMTGGALPIQGGLAMALTRMNTIVEIDRENHIGIVEPGVITGEFQQAAARLDLFYPPDPASLKFSTMGGNAAECAGGPSAVKYGVTKDFIIGLEIVLPDGRIITTGTRTEKGVVGYDLTRMFIGSEGTLGIITKIIVRLLPLPEAKETFLITSNSLSALTKLVSEIIGQGITPRTLEYMDKTAINIVADYLPDYLGAETKGLLILELDGTKKEVADQTRQVLNHLKTLPVFTIQQAKNNTDREGIWRARRSISPAAFSLKPNKISEDVVVPRSRIPDLVACTEDLARQHNLLILTFGHAGDGNIHVNIMLDKKNEQELQKARQAKEELFKTVIALSGTLSGEHGIGITKSPFLALELDPATIDIMQGLKAFFDPLNILNPGKIFPQ